MEPRNRAAATRLSLCRSRDGSPSGMPEDVIDGFVTADGEALGRPVGVAVDRSGALLVAGDVGNITWRVTPAITN